MESKTGVGTMNKMMIKTRISKLTLQEQNWINRLLTTELSKGEFTARQAVYALSETPLVSGGMPKMLPNNVKLNTVMRKSEQFEKISGASSITGKANVWRVKKND
jgi:hypothetical protein